jgi:hypothetical protein
MQRIIVFVLSLFIVTTGFAERFVLDNQTVNPADRQTSKTAIQWANSAKDVDENNNRVKKGIKMNPDSLQILTRAGKIYLDSPKKAEYFRVLVWTNGANRPDFLTNWVDIVANKTYTLDKDHLVPFILMSGTGC